MIDVEATIALQNEWINVAASPFEDSIVSALFGGDGDGTIWGWRRGITDIVNGVLEFTGTGQSYSFLNARVDLRPKVGTFIVITSHHPNYSSFTQGKIALVVWAQKDDPFFMAMTLDGKIDGQLYFNNNNTSKPLTDPDLLIDAINKINDLKWEDIRLNSTCDWHPVYDAEKITTVQREVLKLTPPPTVKPKPRAKRKNLKKADVGDMIN